jgi:hypothetical protein
VLPLLFPSESWPASESWDVRGAIAAESSLTSTRSTVLRVPQGDISVRRVLVSAGTSIVVEFTLTEYDVTFCFKFVPSDVESTDLTAGQTVQLIERSASGRVSFTTGGDGECRWLCARPTCRCARANDCVRCATVRHCCAHFRQHVRAVAGEEGQRRCHCVAAE